MAKLAIASSAFLNIRDDRPAEYYLRPLTDFCKAVTDPHVDITVASEDDLDIPNARNLKCNLDELIQNVWPDRDWKRKYHEMIAKNPTHCQSAQAKYERLIAVYLSKIPLMQMALESQSADAVLWMDAGHWVSVECEGRLERYAGVPRVGENVSATIVRLAEKHGVLGCGIPLGGEHFHMPMSWMREYACRDGPLWTGAFCLIHRNSMTKFFRSVCDSWRCLMDAGRAGTEENAMTISSWRVGWSSIHRLKWIDLLSRSDARL